MAVEDSGPANAVEQDRLKALRRRAAASWMRQSTRFFGRRGWRDRSPRIRCAAREKVVGHQVRGFAEGRDGFDAATVVETTRDFGCKERCRREGARGRNVAGEAFGRGRLRRVGFTCLSLGFVASFQEDVRVKFEEWYNSVEIEGKASVDFVSSTPIAATSTGSAFRVVSKSQERPLEADQFVNAVVQPLPDADV